MTDKRKVSPMTVIILIICLNIIGIFSINCLPPLFTEIITQIPLSKTQMGALMGLFALSAFIFAPIGGILGDRIGCKWTMAIGILLSAASGALRAFTDTPFELMGCMFAVGMGFNLVVPNIPKVIGQWFPSDKLAFINGICMAGLGFGQAAAFAISASVLSPAVGGWREVMLVLGGVYCAIGILWIIIYKDPIVIASHPDKIQHPLEGFKHVSKVKDLWLMSGVLGFQMLGFMGVVAFLPISLEERGISHAGELVAIILAVSVLFNIVGGRISDNIGRRKPILIFGTVLSGFCILTFTSLSGISLIVMFIIAGAGYGAMMPVLFTIPIEMKEIGPEFASTAVGFMMMFQSISGFSGPIIAGWLIDFTSSYLAGFIFMGCVVIIAALFSIPIKETGRKGAECILY